MAVSLNALMLPAASRYMAYAQEAVVDFDIPRGGLGSVVTAISAAGGKTISFPAELASGRSAGPIRGRKSVRAALAQALGGSGLTVADSGGALTVVPVAARGPVGVNANAATDVADIDVVGTRTGDQGFVAGATASSTRVEGSLQDTPQSITGVTKDVITTQAATSGYDAAANVSSVTVTPPTGSSVSPSYTVRGVNANSLLIQGQSAIGTNVPVTDIERVDVIKGPTTILSGVALGGGGINLITKQPTSTPIREVSVYLGSFGYKTIAFDLGGPVPQTEGVTYRLNMSANTADQNYGGYRNPHEYLFSPSVRWEDAVTSVEGGMRFVQERVVPNPFSFYLTQTPSSNPVHIGRTQIIGNPYANARNNTFQPYLSFQRILGDVDMGQFGKAEVIVHSRTQYSKNVYDARLFSTAAIIGNPLNLYILGKIYNHINSDLITSQQDITVKHETQYVRDTMRFGIDYLYQANTVNGSSQLPVAPSTPFAFPPATGVNANFPSYLTATNVPLQAPVNAYQPTTFGSNNIGLSFQDNIDVIERLHILGAVREDHYDAVSNTIKNNVSTRVQTDKAALSYQAGAAFDVLPWMTVYGTSSTGFIPTTVALIDGSAAPPLTSTNDEIGAKLSFLDKRVILTGAVYDLSFSNTTFFNGIGNVLGPGFKSRGVETDVQGQITPNLQAIGSFSFARFNQQTVSSNTPARVTGAPGITASAFLNYTVLDGPLKGFSVGAGGHGSGLSYTAYTGQQVLRVPGYALADFYFGFHRDTYDVNFKLANVFNKYYFDPSSSYTYVPIGEGRNFSLVVKHQF